MKKTVVLLFLCFLTSLNAQVLDEYPKNDFFYQGGEVQFYKEIHDVLANGNYTECPENQIFQPRILVTKEGQLSIVKEYDTAYIAANKCARDLSIQVMKSLKNWKPATVKGKSIGAIAEFIFYPKDLMSGYKEGYVPQKYVSSAKYPKGSAAFNKDFNGHFKTLFADYAINGTFNLEFYINQNGKISNPRVFPEVSNMDFNREFLRTLSRVNKTWIPATYRDLIIKERISFPINFSMKYYDSKSEMTN